MRWFSTLFAEEALSVALSQGQTQILNQGAGKDPDLLLLFISGYSLEEVDSLPVDLRKAFSQTVLLGCTAGGVLGDGREIEQQRALAMTAAWLPEVRLAPFYLDNEQALALLEDSEPLAKTLGVSKEEQPDFILLPDPFSFDPSSFLKILDENFPTSGKIGGLASGGGGPGGNRLFLQENSYDSGLVGVALSGDIAMDTLVAQGCRPIGNPMFITRGQGHMLFELDGKPALQVLEELFQTLSPTDQQLFNQSLFLGIAMRGHQREYHAGDFLIRNLAGMMEKEGGLAIAAHLQEGMVVQFHLRDKNTSAQDLEAMCRRYQMAHGAVDQPPPKGPCSFPAWAGGSTCMESRIMTPNSSENF